MRKLIFLLALAVLALNGCWDAVDINDRNILTAVVVDKTDYGYAFYVEIPPVTGASAEGEASQPKKPSIVKSEGRSLEETRENLDRAMDKPIFLGAVQSVILTDRLACFNIEEYMLRLRQLHDYRKTVHVVVTTEDPVKLLSDKPENDVSVGFAVDDTLMGLAETGQLQHVSLMDVLESLAAPYKHYILPTIALDNEETAFTGFSVFSGGIKTGFIPAAECKSIVFIQAKKPEMMYVVPYRDTWASVQVRLTKKKIKPYYADEKISFNMSLEFKAILMYPEQDKPITETDMAEIQMSLLAILKQEFTETFKKSQEVYHYDCYLLHKSFQNAYPEEYKSMDWAGEYQKVSLLQSITAKLDSSGTIDYNPEQ